VRVDAKRKRLTASATTSTTTDASLTTSFHVDDLRHVQCTSNYAKMCVQLVQELQAHHACLPVGNPRGLEHAYIAAIQAASNAEEDENGTLDRSMTRVLRGIEPGCTKVRRIQVIDALCNHLQAAQILAKQATEDALGTELMEAEIQDVDIAEEKDKQGETRTLTLQLDNMAREVSHHAVSRKHAAHVIAGALAVAMDLSWVDGIHLFDPVLDPKRLAPAQLEKLRALQETFQQEYRVRRQMLIKRVGVTLQSFVCSTRIAENKAEVEGAVEKAMERMKVAPSVSWEDMHRVTHYDLIMMGQRTSFGSQDSFVSSVKSVLMGAVPDRGGRPGDRRAARMPTFQSREADPDPGRKRQGKWNHHSKKKSVRG